MKLFRRNLILLFAGLLCMGIICRAQNINIGLFTGNGGRVQQGNTCPTLTASGVVTDVTCNGGTNGSVNVMITGGGTAPFNFSWNSIPVQTTEDLVNVPAGTYTLTASDANGCPVTGMLTYVVNQPPPIVVTCPGNMTVCLNAPPFALTGGTPAGGTYSGTGVSDGQFNPSQAGTGDKTITYTFTDQTTGCSNSCTYTIAVNSFPVVTCPGNQVVCIAASPFTLTGGTPAGGTYSGAGVSSGQFNPAAAGVGPHTITYSYTDPLKDCSNSCTFTITVNGLPNLNCPGNLITCLNAPPFTLTGGTPTGGTYSGTGVSDGQFNPSQAGTGDKTITCTFTDQTTGCSNSCTYTIAVNSFPLVTCPGNQVVCVAASPFTLTGGTPAGGTYSGAGVSSGQFNPAAAGVGPHTITYSYTDPLKDCSNSCTFTITVNALPNLTCPGNLIACINAAPFTLTGGTPAGGTYSGTGVSDGQFNPAQAGTGDKTITYSFTNPTTGCSNSCTYTIAVNSLPVVTCPGNLSVCIAASPFTLTGGSPAGGTYSGAGVSGGQFDPAAAGVGPHTITYSYTDPLKDCSNSCTFTITVNGLPNLNCPGNLITCLNAPPFTLTGGTPAGGTYSGTGVSDGQFNPAQAGTGDKTITYTFNNPTTGCSNSCTYTIAVNSFPLVTCPGNQVVCIAASPFTLTGGTPAGGTYSGAGVSSGQFNPAAAGVGPHTITYSYTDPLKDCSNSCTFTITVNALPNLTCPGNLIACINAAPFTLTGGTPAGGTYSGTGVSDGQFNPAQAGTGDKTITYSFTNPTTGCSNSCTYTIAVNSLPVVTCPGNLSVCIAASPFTLTGGSPAGGTYSGAGVSGGQFDPAAAGVGPHTITYSYTDPLKDCSNSCTFTITVNGLPNLNCPGNLITCLNAPPFTLTGGTPAGGTYSGTGVSDGQFNPAQAGTGDKTITYTFNNPTTGCSNSCTYTIAVNSFPLVTCPGNQVVCIAASPFTLTGGTPTGGTYSGAGVSGGQFNPAAAGVGPHTITYSYTDPLKDCSNSCTFTITVNALPNLTCPVVDPGKCYKLVVRVSGLSATVVNCKLNDGAAINEKTYTELSCQIWKFADMGDGFFKIIAQHSGKVIGVKQCANNENKPLEQQTYIGLDCQKWSIATLGSYFIITNKNSGKVMAAESGDDLLVQQTQNNSTFQQWSIIEVPCPAPLVMKTPSVEEVKERPGELTLTARPNPSSDYFRLTIEGNDLSTPISVKIFNVEGKVLSEHHAEIGKELLVGEKRWTSGIYFAEVIQGDKRRLVKLVRAD